MRHFSLRPITALYMLGLLFVLLSSSAFIQVPQSLTQSPGFPIDGHYDVVANPLSQLSFQPEMFHMMAQTSGATTGNTGWPNYSLTRTAKLVIYDDHREYAAGSVNISLAVNKSTFGVNDGSIQFVFQISIDHNGKLTAASMSWNQFAGNSLARLHLSGEQQSQEGVLTLSKNNFRVQVVVFLHLADFQIPLPNQAQTPVPILVSYGPSLTHSAVTGQSNGWLLAYGPTSKFMIKYVFINGLYGYDIVMS